MQARPQILIQVFVAFLCAMGAGFSGDLYSHHSQASHHGQRHARGTHHRNRSISRSGYEDHSADVEILRAGRPAAATSAERGETIGFAAIAGLLRQTFVEIGRASVFAVTIPHCAPLLHGASRGPPALS